MTPPQARSGFDSTYSAGRRSILDRSDTYAADRVTLFDDRGRFANVAQCTDSLPAVFRAAVEHTPPSQAGDGAKPHASNPNRGTDHPDAAEQGRRRYALEKAAPATVPPPDPRLHQPWS